MSSGKFLTDLQGVDVSDSRAVKLSRENLEPANFEKCPQRLRHFLVHAVQFQQPLPSKASMLRSEKRNKLKAEKSKPVDDDPKPRFRRKAQRKIKGSLKRRAPAPLPPQPKKRSVQTLKAVRIRSPEENVLRAARQACKPQLEEWFGTGPAEEPAVRVVGQGDKHFPIYFQKKHRSHKRRMKERRELIKANSVKLVELFGGAILNQDCRVSIREVRAALGLLGGEQMDVEENVGEFMAMINEDDESSYSSSSSSYSSSSSSSSSSKQ